MGSLIAQYRVHAVLVSLISAEKNLMQSNYDCANFEYLQSTKRDLVFLVLKNTCENF